MLITGVVGYYVGLYTFLWSQLYTPQRRIKDKIVPDDLLKYKQLVNLELVEKTPKVIRNIATKC